ncbi:MAG TPA: helix-turn-helix domain-containing protein [Williamwhitmania sp.]|nr:helix-turn-helix domain-containing protein [Williamwhitmania sp.]
MKQPDLGKKIAELRKAKGLTQDELVKKCNLNVRTLQRIESGEVSPRSYTVRIIFAALDYNVYDSSNRIANKFINVGLIITNRLEQLYKYVVDLFNLKTNTMKKLLILSVPFITICIALVFSISSNARAQEKMAIREKFERCSSTSKFVQWFNEGQIDSVSLRYSDNACMMPDKYPTLNDRKGINEYFQQLYNRGFRFTQDKSLSTVVSDSIAIDRGIWSISLKSTIVATGTYLTQWRYTDGGWWIENEMSKADIVSKQEEIN